MASLNLSMDSTKSKTEVVQLEELENGIVQITMKDEEHRNTFSPELAEGLSKCFDAVAQNITYKAVIVTGYGNYFASGATKENLIAIHKKEIEFNNSELLSLLLDCKIPVISAMQGHGIGGGLVLGLYADFVVLSQESIYSISSMKYGFTPVGATSLILAKKLGSELGQEMMYTAQNYRGSELAKRGIPFPVLPKKDVLNYAQRLANQIAEKPRLSLVTLKEHSTLELREKLPEFIKKEAEMFETTFRQPEVAHRIETIYGEPKIISNNLHNLSQTWVNEPKDIQNQVPPLPKHLQQLKSGNISIDNTENTLLGTRMRLFCFHGVGGSGLWFQNWSKSFQSDIEVCPVDLPGRATNSKNKPFTEFLPLIETLGEIISDRIDCPFAFYGHSMGALISLELAHLLQQQYCLSPIHLFISGCWSPHHTQDMCSKNLNQFTDLDNLDNLDNLDLNYLGETLDIPPSVIKEGSFLQRSIPIFHADLKLLQSYHSTTKELLNCPISAFGGLEDPIVSKKDILEWCHHTTNTFKLQMLPGKHLFIRDSHNKKLILDALTQDLTISR